MRINPSPLSKTYPLHPNVSSYPLDYDDNDDEDDDDDMMILYVVRALYIRPTLL